MNKFILEQLNKTKINLPAFNENTTILNIPKAASGLTIEDFLVGHSYLCYIEDYIIHEPENFTLSANWNNGTKPVENKIYIQVTQIMGKMIKVHSMGTTSKVYWDGWLPKKSVTILEEIK